MILKDVSYLVYLLNNHSAEAKLCTVCLAYFNPLYSSQVGCLEWEVFCFCPESHISSILLWIGMCLRLIWQYASADKTLLLLFLARILHVGQ